MSAAKSPSTNATCDFWDQLDFKLFACYQSALLPLSNGVQPPHDLFTLWHLEKGQVTIKTAQRELKVVAGETVCLNAMEEREQIFSADSELLSVRFSITWPNTYPLLIEGLPLQVKGPLALHQSGSKLAAFCAHTPSLKYGPFERTRLSMMQYLEYKSIFHQFICEYIQTLIKHECVPVIRRKYDARIELSLQTLSSINAYCQVPYDLLGQIAKLSRNHLDRLFKQELGCSPREFLDRQCLRQACAMLFDHELSISAVAKELHFHDASHFRKWFQRQKGMGPQAFRDLRQM